MKKILIAIDYNPNSEKVVDAGAEIARMMGAEICLLHVISDIRYYGMQYPPFLGYDGFSMPVNFEIQENLSKVAKEFVTSAASHINLPNVSTHISEGDTAQSILEWSKKWKADIVVMGTHSHSAIEKIFMGTVASSVLEHTEIPIYLVPIKKLGKQ